MLFVHQQPEANRQQHEDEPFWAKMFTFQPPPSPWPCWCCFCLEQLNQRNFKFPFLFFPFISPSWLMNHGPVCIRCFDTAQNGFDREWKCEKREVWIVARIIVEQTVSNTNLPRIGWNSFHAKATSQNSEMKMGKKSFPWQYQTNAWNHIFCFSFNHSSRTQIATDIKS